MTFSSSVRRLALGQMLLAVILSNMNPLFAKRLLGGGWEPHTLYFAVLIVMSAVLCIHEFIAIERGERWGMTRRDVFGTLLSTLTGGVIGPLLFFTGLTKIAASEALLLSSAAPFFVVIFAIFLLKERFTAQMFLGSLTIIAGIVLVLWQEIVAFQFQAGSLFILGSAILGAFTTIVHKKYIVHRHIDSIVLVRTLLATVIIGTWIWLTDPEAFGALSAPQNVWVLLAFPLLTSLLPFFLYFRSLRKVKAMDAGIVSAMGKVVGIMLASTILGEVLELRHVMSMICVIFGIFFINVPLTRWRIVPSRLLDIGPLRK